MTEIEFTNTHLYPGARGQIIAGDSEGGDLRAVFADGVVVMATLSDDSTVLNMPAYRTTAGRHIAAKRWGLTLDGTAVRVTARA